MGTELSGNCIQFIPEYCLYDIAKHPSARAIAQVLFNIVMTIPFGAYLKYYWKMDMKKIALVSFAFTVFIEVGQLTGFFFMYPGSYRFNNSCDKSHVLSEIIFTITIPPN